MEGLAQSAAAPQQPQGASQDAAMLEQIVQLLIEGVDPEELVSQGVPPEIIMQAIQIIEQQMGAQQGQPAAPAGPQGLASSSVGM